MKHDIEIVQRFQGFGDFVPGVSDLLDGKITSGAGIIFMAAIYIIIGMAIMATFLDLIQCGMERKIGYISQLFRPKKKNA